ncbi:MAG: hypothetical protein IKR86_07860 [Candidatus Methanomethylophilaceae archaeon]|nr:hypothetical protein [Candidatus Methanomethylophilaceae archaeon]
MSSFRNGDVVPMRMGGKARILSDEPLGRGGQGEVYLVEYKGSQHALKWYTSLKMRANIEFRDNLIKNAHDGAPGGRFAWPLDVTEDMDGSFGYVMPLLPKDNEDFSDFLRSYRITKTEPPRKVPVRFSDPSCLFRAGLQIVESFMALHRKGKSYQDLNDGGISMDMSTGDVVICDCDNIAPDGVNYGIAGKQGYMAPEIVLNRNRPNVYSDRFSLAVILFKLFFRDDPFWGRKVCNCCNLTDFNYRRFYGEEPVFIYHPTDLSNRPVAGIHNNVIRMWKHYPDFFKKLFLRAFVDGVDDTSRRPLETEWASALVRLRSEALRCPCGGFSFVSDDAAGSGSCSCPGCGKSYPVMILGGTRLPLVKGAAAYQAQVHSGSDDVWTVSMEVVENRKTPGLMGIKNLDSKPWEVVYDDSRRTLKPGEGTSIKPGMVVEFETRTKGIVPRSV